MGANKFFTVQKGRESLKTDYGMQENQLGSQFRHMLHKLRLAMFCSQNLL